jgi:hypothetical protein
MSEDLQCTTGYEMSGWRKLIIIMHHPIQCFTLWRWTRNKDQHFVGLVNGTPTIQIVPKVPSA